MKQKGAAFREGFPIPDANLEAIHKNGLTNSERKSKREV
jgi:hypothetical protein